MKIDKKMLDSLLDLPDDKLLSMIKLISGGELSCEKADSSTVAGLRRMLEQVTDSDIERATQLITQYKKGKKQGGRNGYEKQ